MSNSIRTPKQGVTAGSRRIAEAVDDEDWQTFRVSMKGTATTDKLRMLREYWLDNNHTCEDGGAPNCDVCIRVDNYIKALCRGGQLFPGESLLTACRADWKLEIKS